jgi:hypothetical protein
MWGIHCRQALMIAQVSERRGGELCASLAGRAIRSAYRLGIPSASHFFSCPSPLKLSNGYGGGFGIGSMSGDGFMTGWPLALIARLARRA